MRTVSTVRIFYLLGDKMENYSYRLLVLKCVSLNCLHIEDMDTETLLNNVKILGGSLPCFSMKEIKTVLLQMLNDGLISVNNEHYHIEEKGEKIRTAMIMDYLHCGDVIANSFDLKRKNAMI